MCKTTQKHQKRVDLNKKSTCKFRHYESFFFSLVQELVYLSNTPLWQTYKTTFCQNLTRSFQRYTSISHPDQLGDDFLVAPLMIDYRVGLYLLRYWWNLDVAISIQKIPIYWLAPRTTNTTLGSLRYSYPDKDSRPVFKYWSHIHVENSVLSDRPRFFPLWWDFPPKIM